jgi:aquaporin rerated protein, other eukaryote
VLFYRFVKILEYETANPGQDFNDKEAAVFHHDEANAATGADVARPNIQVGHPDFVADDLGMYSSTETRQYPGTGVNSPPGSRGGVNGNGYGKTDIERPANTSTVNPTLGREVRNDAAYQRGPAMEDAGLGHSSGR